MPSTVELPPRFRDRTLDSYRADSPTAKRALNDARRLVAGEIKSLVLIGATGVGKTHIAAGVATALDSAYEAAYEEGKDTYNRGETERWPSRRTAPMWTNVADLIVRMRLDMDRPLDDREASMLVMRMHRHQSLVILDDLGREKTSDWTGETIYALVNARYEAMLPTLVTSNLTAADLASSPYWPVISRLAEDGALVEIEAPDHRLAR